MKNSTLWESWFKYSLHDHSTEVFIVGYIILTGIYSRSQLPQNGKILYRCFGRRLLQNRHESDWNFTVYVVLVSPYSIQELPSPNFMRRYLLVTRKSPACSKSLQKPRNSFASLCYGFFSVDTEYVRQYQQFSTTHLLAKHFGQGLTPSRHLRDWCSIYAVPVSTFADLDKSY